MAMPTGVALSTSLTLSTPPGAELKSTRDDTSVPTAPDGAPASSATVEPTGVLVASRTGASLTAMPVTDLDPVIAAATPSLTLVAIVKLPLKFAAGLKVTPASSALTSAIAPDAVHTPALKVDVTAPE